MSGVPDLSCIFINYINTAEKTHNIRCVCTFECDTKIIIFINLLKDVFKPFVALALPDFLWKIKEHCASLLLPKVGPQEAVESGLHDAGYTRVEK